MTRAERMVLYTIAFVAGVMTGVAMTLFTL